MTPEQFCYWLQGFAELNPAVTTPTPEQWQAIQDHLKLVFHKVTPPITPSAPAPTPHKQELDKMQMPQIPLFPRPPNDIIC